MRDNSAMHTSWQLLPKTGYNALHSLHLELIELLLLQSRMLMHIH